MYYQKQPNWDVYFRKTKTGHNEVRTHLHGFYELHCCTEGQLDLTIDGRRMLVKAGNAVIIFPYQAHSFVKSDGQGCFFTFDPDLIGTFDKQFANMVPKDGQFSFCYDFDSLDEDSDVYALKAFLYAMCSAASKLEYLDTVSEGRGLLEKIFLVTEKNYTDPSFSLQRLASILEYDYGYLSKYFLKITGIKYGLYLNQRRIALSVRILHSGGPQNVCDVAFECGYSSVRSFNRNFQRIEGKTPTEYLNTVGL